MIKLIKKASIVVAVASGLMVSATVANAGGDLKYQRSTSWQGFYLGGFLGGASSNFGKAEGYIESEYEQGTLDGIFGSTAWDNDTDGKGFTGGVHLGYNIHKGNVVFGIEGDVSIMDTEISGTRTYDSYSGDYSNQTKEKYGLEYLASLRARLGYTHNKTLLYATAGIAWTELEYSRQFTSTTGQFDNEASLNEKLTGYIIGAGVEHKLWNKASLRGEVLYYDFEADKFDDTNIDITVVRGGLTWHFN